MLYKAKISICKDAIITNLNWSEEITITEPFKIDAFTTHLRDLEIPTPYWWFEIDKKFYSVHEKYITRLSSKVPQREGTKDYERWKHKRRNDPSRWTSEIYERRRKKDKE